MSLDYSTPSMRLAASVLAELVERADAPAVSWTLMPWDNGASLTAQPYSGLTDEDRREQVTSWAALLGFAVTETRCHPETARKRGGWFSTLATEGEIRDVRVTIFAHISETPYVPSQDEDPVTTDGGAA